MMLKSFNSISKNQIRSYICLANTAAFLYKKINSDLSTKLLADNNKTVNLIEKFNQLINKKKLSSYDIVYLYALIGALSNKNNLLTFHFFKNISKYDLRWFKEFSNFYINKYTPNSYEEININSQNLNKTEGVRSSTPTNHFNLLSKNNGKN